MTIQTTNNTRWPKQASVISDEDLFTLTEKCLADFNQLIKQQSISEDLTSQLKDIYLPLAAWMANKHSDTPLVFGINGAQGSGKSTLSHILKMLLAKHFAKLVVTVSIDDFYLSRQARQELANEVHPLFKVRGVPGTHNVALAEQVIASLVKGKLPIKLPLFDKAIDDLLPEAEWTLIDEPVDIILFEGWCVGAQAQQQSDLDIAVNELEQQDDAECVWRNYANAQLKKRYQSLFAQIDYLLMLKVPDMASVLEWRGLQEAKLARQCIEQNQSSAQMMSVAQLSRFIMHYERLTRSMLSEMPKQADVVMELNHLQQIKTIHVVT